jgi:glycogen operon protein
MVARLHDAGIEVILDVVYNHTGEGNELDPTLSFRGIDNASYYRLMPDDARHYINDTGTGNTFNLGHPRVLQMVMDSLRYWAGEMHVDGFRFDLATALGRGSEGFNPHCSFLDSLRQDPMLAESKLIAEPWDLGPGGYQLGQYGHGWSEWNDRYRDTVRRLWRGDGGVLPELATRITASADLFDHDGRRPRSSINFVTAHDGFTLEDLVSYEHKHNEANQEDNRDGTDNNISANHGAEGATDDPAIIALRRRQRRNFLTTLLLSQGTPMLLAGDEFARTQGGNNNAYCQDTEISWVDWSRLDDDRYNDVGFVRHLLELRRDHAALRWPHFLHGRVEGDRGLKDITWVAPDGNEMSDERWSDDGARTLGVLLNGNVGNPISDTPPPLEEILLWLINAHADEVEFRLPDLSFGDAWIRVLDTASDAPGKVSSHACGETYALEGRSQALFYLTSS